MDVDSVLLAYAVHSVFSLQQNLHTYIDVHSQAIKYSIGYTYSWRACRMHGDTVYIILLTPGFQKSSANTTVEEAVSVRPLGEKCNHVYIYTYIDRKLSTYCTHQHWLQYLPQLASKQTDRDRQRQREHCTHQHWLQYLPQLASKQTDRDRQRQREHCTHQHWLQYLPQLASKQTDRETERAPHSPALVAVSTTTSQQADRDRQREREHCTHQHWRW